MCVFLVFVMQAAPQASFQKETSMYILHNKNDAILHFRDRKSSTVWKIDVISGVIFGSRWQIMS